MVRGWVGGFRPELGGRTRQKKNLAGWPALLPQVKRCLRRRRSIATPTVRLSQPRREGEREGGRLGCAVGGGGEGGGRI